MTARELPDGGCDDAVAESHLIRRVGLWGMTTLNMIDMIGVGPFTTIPLIND